MFCPRCEKYLSPDQLLVHGALVCASCVERDELEELVRGEREALEAKDNALTALRQMLSVASDAITAERERCAKVAEEYRSDNPYPTVYAAIAAAIRKGE